MNTTGERVEITPELLDRLAQQNDPNPKLPWGKHALTPLVHPSVVAALVARIRELESEREAFTPEMVESINECIGAGISWCSMHGDPVDTDGADAARSLIESILLKRP